MWEKAKYLHVKLADVAEDLFLLLARAPGRGYVALAAAAALGHAAYSLFA